MARRCCVPSCENKFYTTGISMHAFPRDPNVSCKWQKAVSRGDETKFPETSNFVCSAHFRPSDFLVGQRRTLRRLVPGAVPTIFPWFAARKRRFKRAEMSESTRPPDFMDCEEILPESVEMVSCQELVADEKPIIPEEPSDPFESSMVKQEPFEVITIDDDPEICSVDSVVIKDEPLEVITVNDDPEIFNVVSDVTKGEPFDNTRVKEEPGLGTYSVETVLIKSEPFDLSNLKEEPELDTFVPEDVLPTFDHGLSKELIKIVDIQDIFSKKDSEMNIPKIHSVISLSSNSSSILRQPPKTSNASMKQNDSCFSYLKKGDSLLCKECKMVLSDKNSVKWHKCPVEDPKNFQCMVCDLSFVSVADLKSHLSLEHPNVQTYQNPMGKLLSLSTSGHNMIKGPQDQSLSSQIEIVNTNVDVVKPEAVAKFISIGQSILKKNFSKFIGASQQKLYSHFCKSHLKIEDSATVSKTTSAPFECSHCPKICETTEELDKHLNTNHSDCVTYQCKVCQFTENCRLDQFLDHLSTHDEYLKPGIIYECTECENLCNNVLTHTEQQKHEITFHLKQIVIVRTLTSKGVYFRYRLGMRTNRTPVNSCTENKKPFGCFCSKTFENQSDLDVHLETHVDCVFQKCSKCAWDCDNMYMYYKHIEQTHKLSVLDDLDFRNQKVKFFYKRNEFTCFNQDCNGTFINNCSLQLHIRQQHTPRLEQFSTDFDKELKCPICEVVFLDQKLFYAHCVPYTPLLPKLDNQKDKCDIVQCKICNMVQKSLEHLDCHVLEEHNVLMVHCILCKSDVLCEQEAYSHLKSCLKSSQVENFNCPICGYICPNFDYLIKHVRDDLQKTKSRQQCKFCLNFFYGKFNLAHHILNAKCNLCDLYFCNVRNLTVHRKLVHEC